MGVDTSYSFTMPRPLPPLPPTQKALCAQQARVRRDLLRKALQSAQRPYDWSTDGL